MRIWSIERRMSRDLQSLRSKLRRTRSLKPMITLLRPRKLRQKPRLRLKWKLRLLLLKKKPRLPKRLNNQLARRSRK